MLKISAKMLAAVETVVDIAYNSGGQPVQSREITRRQGIARRYLESVLQTLVREKILIGLRGPNGGYCLARERRRISLGDISRAMQTMNTQTDPSQSMPTEKHPLTMRSDLEQKILHPLWEDLRTDLLEKLDHISIQDLCTQAHKIGVSSEMPETLDYTI